MERSVKWHFTDVWGGMKETVLWTNSSPSSSFASTTITLSESMASYDYIKISYLMWNTSSVENARNILIPMSDFALTTDSAAGLMNALAVRSSNNRVARVFARASDTQIKFIDAYRINSTTKDNNGCIPYKIYGVKI